MVPNKPDLDTGSDEGWINRRWRPMMALMYFSVCIFDFILFPIAWSAFQAYYQGSVTTPWSPLTLQGAGLFHMAMGAILGVSAWSRGQEKIAYMQNGPYGNQSFITTSDNINTRPTNNKKPPLIQDPEL